MIYTMVMKNVNEETWPNFFIVGAPKAGTTSLHAYLSNVEGIFMSNIKEPHYFSIENIHETRKDIKPIRKKNEYLNIFKKANKEKIIGESSTSYLADRKAPKLIHNVSSNAKILISLRDPVERAFSQYLMRKKNFGIFQSTFKEEIEKEIKFGVDNNHPYINLNEGFYSQSIKNYLDIFGTEKIKIIIFEDWIKNPKKIIGDILIFLNISINLTDFEPIVRNQFVEFRGSLAKLIFNSKTLAKISNFIMIKPTKQYLKEKILFTKKPKPTMEKDARKLLVNYYKDDVEKLEILLGRKLPWKNFDSIDI